jgi:hypothetical protein
MTKADLAAVIALPDTTTNDLTVLHVSLTVSNANLDVPVITGDLESPYDSKAGQSTKGKFDFKKNRTLTGVFNSSKTSAKIGKSGGYTVSFKGSIENKDDASLEATGPIQIQIGNVVTEIPPNYTSNGTLKSFKLVPDKHTFSIETAELENTGIPAPGEGSATSYWLPLTIKLPTGQTTNLFETVIELKRSDGTDNNWKR